MASKKTYQILAAVFAAVLVVAGVRVNAWAAKDGAKQSDGTTTSGSVIANDSDYAGEPIEESTNEVETETETSEDAAKSLFEGTDASSATQLKSGDAPQALDAEGNVVNEAQLSDSSFLLDASIADVMSADSYYDNQTVQIEGEVVGEAIYPFANRGSYCWITLLDPKDDSSISVWMSVDDLEKIDTFGGYGKTGTTLRVQGEFHLECHEHQGESDIHAKIVTVVEPGSEHKDQLSLDAWKPAFIAFILAGIVGLIYWRLRERTR